MAKKLREIVEEKKDLHIHVHDLGKGKGFKVHSVGAHVEKKIKKGMVVSSGDLDDFSQSGYKVKETKAPKS